MQPNLSSPEHGQHTDPVRGLSISTGTTKPLDQKGSYTTDDDSQLLQPSGLRMVNKAKRTAMRCNRWHRQKLTTFAGKENRDLNSLRKSKRNCQVEIPHNGHLEFFGFHATIPKKVIQFKHLQWLQKRK